MLHAARANLTTIHCRITDRIQWLDRPTLHLTLPRLTEYICPVMTRKPEEPDHFLGVPPHHTTITPTLPWPLILTWVHLMLFPLLTVTQLHRHYSSEEWAAQMACSSACPWAPRTETRIISDVADRLIQRNRGSFASQMNPNVVREYLADADLRAQKWGYGF